MNRSRKIIQLLEGFKLGDLGAGKPKLAVPVVEPVGKPKPRGTQPTDTGYKTARVQWTKAERAPDDLWINAVRWTEVNSVYSSWEKYKLFSVCQIIKQGESYLVDVLGGLNTKGILNPPPHAESADFLCRYVFKSPSNARAREEFFSLYHRILLKGSFGLALSTGEFGEWKLRQGSDVWSYLERTTGTSETHYLS